MNSRWYISILIITLTFLGGVASTQQVIAPNQEIVLQFSSDEVSAEDTAAAIANVKDQLKTAGVSHITVKKGRKGQLKITYFSTSNVDRIKLLLAHGTSLDLDVAAQTNHKHSLPSQEQTTIYNFDVYEIHQGGDFLELGNPLALEIKVENDRLISFNPVAFVPSKNYDSNTNQVAVAYKRISHSVLAIASIAYQIPEVRAGPLS